MKELKLVRADATVGVCRGQSCVCVCACARVRVCACARVGVFACVFLCVHLYSPLISAMN